MTTFSELGLPTPKYGIGDRVYRYFVIHDKVPLVCPDCGDKREVRVVFPDGRELKAGCPRCTDTSYHLGQRLPALLKPVFRLEIQALTIGSVKIDTSGHYGEPISYMCNETGVGSGTVYDEGRLFKTPEEAADAGALDVKRQQEALDAHPDTIKVQSIGRLNITDALIEDHRRQVWSSWYHTNNIVSSVETIIEEAEHKSKSELLYDLRNAVQYDMDYDKATHPLSSRLTAAEALVEFFRESIVDGILVAKWPQDLMDRWNVAVRNSTLRPEKEDGEDHEDIL